MTNIVTDKAESFFTRSPLLLPTIEKLNAARIPFAIGGSGCLYLFGNERIPDDVDIYLPDVKHDAADRLFGIESYAYRSESEDMRNSNPGGSHDIQLTSHLILNVGGREYRLSLDQAVLDHCFRFQFKGQDVTLLPVEDVLLIKVLLQRGPDVGKHDIEDIHAFMKIHPDLQMDYLQSRIRAFGAQDRAGDIFGS